MKKKMILILITTFILCAAAGCSKPAEPFFKQLDGMNWYFSSGAGAWSSDLRIFADGSFSGEYHDSDMGDCADDYLGGTLYYCAFTGRMSLVRQEDKNTWRIRVDKLERAEGQEGETVEDGTRIIYTEPYGLSEGDEMLLFRPGTPVNGFTEEMKMWAHLYDTDAVPSELETWFLASEKNDSGFVGTADVSP